jgi:hypothetical protein
MRGARAHLAPDKNGQAPFIHGPEGVFVGGIVAQVGNGRARRHSLENQPHGVAFVAPGAQFNAAVELRRPHPLNFIRALEEFDRPCQRRPRTVG